MKTLSIFSIAWLSFLTLVIASQLLLPYWPLKVVAATLLIWKFGSLLPVSLDEMGQCVAYYLKQYGLGDLLARLAYFFYLIPYWRKPAYLSSLLINRASISLVRNEKKEALQLAREACEISVNANWEMRFRCLTVMGEVLFHLKEYDDAKKHLFHAEEIYEKNCPDIPVTKTVLNSDGELESLKAHVVVNKLEQEERQYYVKCIDLLAMLYISEDNEHQSWLCFSKGVSIRQENETLIPTSRAYEAYVEGIKLLRSGKRLKAEKQILEAASLLPSRMKYMQDHYVLIIICSALSEFDSPDTNKVKSGIKQAFAKRLHPLQLKLLDTPILNAQSWV